MIYLLVCLIMISVLGISSRGVEDEPLIVDEVIHNKMKVKSKVNVPKKPPISTELELPLDKKPENSSPVKLVYNPEREPVSKEEAMEVLRKIYEGGRAR